METKIVKCKLCKNKIHVEQPEPEINQYILDLGYKHTNIWWHHACLENYFKYPEYFNF